MSAMRKRSAMVERVELELAEQENADLRHRVLRLEAELARWRMLSCPVCRDAVDLSSGWPAEG